MSEKISLPEAAVYQKTMSHNSALSTETLDEMNNNHRT